MNSKQHYFKWCGSRRVIICAHLEAARRLITWLPRKHYVQRFTLLLLLCENDLWLTERSASFLRLHAWRNNKPCFCPADGFLLLLSPLILDVDIKSTFFIPPKTQICSLNKAPLSVCMFHSLFSERLSIRCINSENKLRVYNTIGFRALSCQLVYYSPPCVRFGTLPVSLFEPAGIDGTCVALNPFVMMAEERSRFVKSIMCVREVIPH